jgi:hypothetical protein
MEWVDYAAHFAGAQAIPPDAIDFFATSAHPVDKIIIKT